MSAALMNLLPTTKFLPSPMLRKTHLFTCTCAMTDVWHSETTEVKTIFLRLLFSSFPECLQVKARDEAFTE